MRKFSVLFCAWINLVGLLGLIGVVVCQEQQAILCRLAMHGVQFYVMSWWFLIFPILLGISIATAPSGTFRISWSRTEAIVLRYRLLTLWNLVAVIINFAIARSIPGFAE